MIQIVVLFFLWPNFQNFKKVKQREREREENAIRKEFVSHCFILYWILNVNMHSYTFI
jgi:hypothetical protein